MGLCTSSLPMRHAAQSVQLADSSFCQQIACCMVIFEVVKRVFLPTRSLLHSPAGGLCVPTCTVDEVRDRAEGRNGHHPLLFLHLFPEPMLLRSSQCRPGWGRGTQTRRKGSFLRLKRDFWSLRWGQRSVATAMTPEKIGHKIPSSSKDPQK